MSGWKTISRLFIVPEHQDGQGDDVAAEPSEIERLLASVRSEHAPEPTASGGASQHGTATASAKRPAAAPPPSPGGGAVGTPGGPALVEGRPFESLYFDAGVPTSPYPVERLLKLLEGLHAMDPSTRATVVAALDAADDTWTIADPVLDAQRKIDALGGAKSTLAEALGSVEVQGASQAEAQERYLADATTEIRRQIAELQAMLEREIATVTAHKADIDTNVRAAREAYAREAARLDAEIGRLEVIPKTFTPVSRRH